MPLCKNCGHPHGWYDGFCAACAASLSASEESDTPTEPEDAEAKKPEKTRRKISKK